MRSGECKRNERTLLWVQLKEEVGSKEKLVIPFLATCISFDCLVSYMGRTLHSLLKPFDSCRRPQEINDRPFRSRMINFGLQALGDAMLRPTKMVTCGEHVWNIQIESAVVPPSVVHSGHSQVFTSQRSVIATKSSHFGTLRALPIIGVQNLFQMHQQ